MANLSRNAKSSSDWTDYELLAFNIRVENVSMETMFNTTQLPSAHVSDTILDNTEKPDGQLSKDDRLFFRYLEMVERPSSLQSNVIDFTAHILHILNYDDQDRVICQGPQLPFTMSGMNVDAKSDICVQDDDDDFLLLVQEEKGGDSLDDPEPRIIAEAIATFYQNNLRRRDPRLPQLDSKYIPAITMFGSAPTFYRIPVTTTFLNALMTGCYPAEELVVLRYTPPVPNLWKYRNLGMRPLSNRRIVLQCFEGFKALL